MTVGGTIVADCSFVAALCLYEREFGDTETIQAARQMLLAVEVLVPAIWPTELANSIVQASRRSRITADRIQHVIAAGFTFAPRVQPPPDQARIHAVVALALRHGLTVYDALYVDLAVRTGSVLASLDGAMLRAARQEGIAIVGDPA